jgi:hypothetical protein
MRPSLLWNKSNIDVPYDSYFFINCLNKETIIINLPISTGYSSKQQEEKKTEEKKSYKTKQH